MRDRLKGMAVWAGLIGLALLVGAYLLGALALVLVVIGKYNGSPEAWEWYLAVLRHPRALFTLVATDQEVKRYTIGIVTLVGCLVLWAQMNRQTQASRPQVASSYGSHGTGRWATSEEVLRTFESDGPGAVLGRLWERGRWRPVIFPWSSRTRNRFVLIVGPPGSGKTSRYSLPNLVHAARCDKQRSLLVTDPKGDLYRDMAELLREQGWEIRSVNLLQPRASDRYNPMDYVRSVEDAFRLANTIISNTSGTQVAGDAFWTNAERSLLACLIWYAKRCLKPEHQHLAAVLHLGNTFAKNQELMEATFEAPGVDETARRLYAQVASLSDKTRDGVFIGFAVRLQLWASPEIAALTASSDFDLRDLGRKPTALFVIIPDHHSTYQALTSLFFDQAFQELITAADENGGRLEHEVRLMLEEMANIGRIPDLEKRLATIRSRGLLVEMILQTIGQLKAGYGEAWNTITGCADTILALAANDQETAEWLSKRLGTSTIRTTSTSSTQTDKGASNSESQHYTSRALMLPDEVQGQGEEGLGEDQLLLIQRGMAPARLLKYPIDEFPGQEQRRLRHPREHEVASRPIDAAPLPELEKRRKRDGDDDRPTWLAGK